MGPEQAPPRHLRALLSPPVVTGHLFSAATSRRAERRSRSPSADVRVRHQLVGEDYSGRDLTAEFYTKGSLKRAKFGGSNLADVTLPGADQADTDFTGADLTTRTSAGLTMADLKGANLSGAIVSGASMDDLGDIARTGPMSSREGRQRWSVREEPAGHQRCHREPDNLGLCN